MINFSVLVDVRCEKGTDGDNEWKEMYLRSQYRSSHSVESENKIVSTKDVSHGDDEADLHSSLTLHSLLSAFYSDRVTDFLSHFAE